MPKRRFQRKIRIQCSVSQKEKAVSQHHSKHLSARTLILQILNKNLNDEIDIRVYYRPLTADGRKKKSILLTDTSVPPLVKEQINDIVAIRNHPFELLVIVQSTSWPISHNVDITVWERNRGGRVVSVHHFTRKDSLPKRIR